jgi:hypothetical protein
LQNGQIIQHCSPSVNKLRKPDSSVALHFVDSNKIGMEQASKQAGVSMIMVRVWCPAQKQLSKIHFEKN